MGYFSSSYIIDFGFTDHKVKAMFSIYSIMIIVISLW